ncbi:MAG: alpha-2-macroglobulin, partial [Bacteroidales bacterium]|nr:alpha-2-macroglobulin [Bacteroidales bacterium]
ADDPYIDIYFSGPMADIDDDNGLFTLEGTGRYYVQAENNRVKVFYESMEDGQVTLRISEAVKSHDGTRLGSEYSKTFAPAEEKPAVEIPMTGNILPNPKELVLPFKAVNLNAVDISVIQIYEDNVLMFLQENRLGDGNALRRSGRLVYKRCIRLDSDPSKNLHKWQDYSVDLSGLFKQEAGAIYRIRLSFKQDYSVYGKAVEFKSGTPTDQLVNIASEGITEEDDKKWDRPDPWYYDGYAYDWSRYNWKDRDNPLKESYYMEEDRFPAVNLLSSNLGVIAKYSGTDKLWVSVSDIISAEPVFNSELYVYSYQLKEIGYAKTGTDGMAEISLSGRPFVVVAKRGAATSYLKVSEGDEKTMSRFDVGGKVIEKGIKAFIYGERGVWRPGDTLHVTMILEDKDKTIPDNHPAIMELYTPESRFYAKMINGSAKDGFYIFDIPTKPEDPTGDWMAYFKIGGATFHKSLKIESIKPNRLKIALDLGDGPIEGGRTMQVGVSSNWLTGPPASGLGVTMDMTLRKGLSSFKGFEGYTFTTPLTDFVRSEHNLADTRLDQNGDATMNIDMPSAEGAPGMLTADIVTRVTEPGGDFSFNAVSVPYSPYSSYAGVKIPKEEGGRFLETDKDYKLNLAVVDKDGKNLDGVDLTYAIYKIKWSWWWESREESLDSYVNGTDASTIASGTIKSSKNCSIPFKVDYPEWGRYLVLVRDEESGHMAGDIMYVDWPAYRGRSSKADPDALTMLSFTTDKESYNVGEKVTVFIPAAAKGQALVSLENSRTVISRKWVKTSGEGDVAYSFKVTPEMAPNFYINITLIQPHERPENDLPIRLYGVRPVIVNDTDSHLEPEISMPDVLRPEEEFKVKIREKSGKPMTYTIAIVDEGLLDLTGFKTPDPWMAMYEREALGVKTWDLYDYVIGAYSGRFSPMFSIGGDEDMIVGAKKDNRFNPVVKFLGPFTLNTGSATHKITLPMYVGSVRVMVVAAHGSVYGNAEKTVPVRSPLMVLPTLPRVLGTGEKVTLPVNVFALEDDVRNTEVSVSVEGPLKVVGESKAKVSFDKPGDKLVKFALEATGEGPAKVTVSASGGSHKAGDAISIMVRDPGQTSINVVKAMIGKDETKHLGFSPFTSDGRQWGSLELSTFPAVDYEGIFSYVKDYGFECSEQLASRGISLISIREML